MENQKLDEEELESQNILKDMVQNLDELPTDVLKQLYENLEKIEEYNKTHPEEIYDDKK